MMLVAVILGVLVGVVLGLMGSGGSILTMPLLVYVLHVPVKEAVGASLIIVAGTALAGLLAALRSQAVCLRSGGYFGFSGMILAYFGNRLAQDISADMQMILLAVILLFAGAMMFGKKMWAKYLAHERSDCNIPVIFSLSAGAVVGLLTGLLGVGGGFLIVPALLVAGLNMQHATATSLFIIVLNALAALVGSWGQSLPDWQITASFLGGAVVAAIVAGRGRAKIPAEKLQKIFGLFVVAIGIFILAEKIL